MLQRGERRSTALVLAAAAGILALVGTGRSHKLVLVIGAAVVLLVLRSIARRPGPWLAFLLAYLPTSQVLLSWLLWKGLPVSVVTDLGYAKELITVGVVLHVLRGPHRRLTWLPGERAIAGFLALCFGYFLLPYIHAFDVATSGQRQTDLRGMALWLVLLCALRRVDVPERDRHLIDVTFRVTIVVVALCAIYEVAQPDSWNDFIANTIHYSNFQQQLTGADKSFHFVVVETTTSGSSVTRAGSTFINALALGHWSIIAVTVATFHLVTRGPRPWTVSLLGLAVTASVLSGTRSAVLGAALAAVLVVFLAGASADRLRAAIFGGAALVLASPFVLRSAVSVRSKEAVAGTDTSTTGHGTQTDLALTLLHHHPFGLGMGAGQLGLYFTEDGFLQLGVRVGILGIIAFAAGQVLLLQASVRRSRHVGRGSQAPIAAGIIAGLMANAFLLEVYEVVNATVSAAVLVGLALSAGGGEGPRPASRQRARALTR